MTVRLDRVAVRNAADREQVTRADRAQAKLAARFLGSLRAVMETPEGRLVMWSLLGKFGTYASVFSPEPAVMAHRAGRQDAGNELRVDLLAAGEDLFQVMEMEMRALAEQEQRGADAVQQRDRSDEVQ